MNGFSTPCSNPFKTASDVRIPAGLPNAYCDRVQVREVLYNLLTNSLKYNDKDHKWIEIGCAESPVESIGNASHDTGQNETETVFYVRDNGIGIREKHLSKIFTIFKRLHGRDKYGGGVGAGLSIIQKIIRRHAGRIWVESEYGEGSTFYFTLEGDTRNDCSTETTDSDC